MFERELVDSMFLDRWTIVRTINRQSVAEHTFLVAHYANDIAVCLGIDPKMHLGLLQFCLWHDAADEIFTGDLPGPNKRGLLDAIGPEAKEKWDAKLREWSHRTFSNLTERMGGSRSPNDAYIVLLIAKVADWMEASVRMATEDQMGNRCASRHITPNMKGAIETLHKLIEARYGVKVSTDEVPINPTLAERMYTFLHDAIVDCVDKARRGQSAGPWITREDDSRTYHDPCVDNDAL